MPKAPYHLADETRDEVFTAAAARFLILSEPTRLKIMRAICCGEKSVTAIAERTGTTQPNISHHLRMMHRAGMISRRRDGSQIFYGVADAQLLAICQTICESVAGAVEKAAVVMTGASSLFEHYGTVDVEGPD